MSVYADLEIKLLNRDGNGYTAEVCYSQPGSDTDVRLLQGEAAALNFDLAALNAAIASDEYAPELGKALWTAPLHKAFVLARANAEALQADLRLRLFVDASADELHSLHWETLCDPDNGQPLFTNGNLLFSRYLSSDDFRPIDMRPMRDLKALVVVANPQGLMDDFELAEIDVVGEEQRARAGLGTIPVVPLVSDAGKPGNATLSRISAELLNGYDILYLVCHGAVNPQGEPLVYLEGEDNDARAGKVKPTLGAELAACLNRLNQRPRLVVLASCESAGNGTGSALNALGPLLANAGVPAVIAMQGQVSMEMVKDFMPAFFSELHRTGQIDRAMAVARSLAKTRNHDDWWMPVLFMRLKSGRVGWYTPGLTATDEGKNERWEVLIENIRNGNCTPILGPGLQESLVGPAREIARRWGTDLNFPLAPHNRDDLPQIAQYRAILKSNQVARVDLIKRLCQELIKLHADVPSELRATNIEKLNEKDAAKFLNDLFSTVGAQRRAKEEDEPHRVLAGLGLPLYISANPDNMLADALTTAGKSPQVEYSRWSNQLAEKIPMTLPEEYEPSPEAPLVYHPFGHLSQPTSLVLTQDNFLDYLIGISKDTRRTPSMIPSALVSSALLFLGFQLDDWSFRALFRSIVNLEGRELSSDAELAHVAVQVDPSSGSFSDPESARGYFNQYFSRGANGAKIEIYWGSADDFAQDLRAEV